MPWVAAESSLTAQPNSTSPLFSNSPFNLPFTSTRVHFSMVSILLELLAFHPLSYLKYRPLFETLKVASVTGEVNAVDNTHVEPLLVVKEKAFEA